MKARIDYSTLGMTGVLIVETDLYFPCQKYRLEKLESVLWMHDDDAQLREFLESLQEGVIHAKLNNRVARSALLYLIEQGSVKRTTADKELRRINRDERMLDSNEEVITRWLEQLTT